MPHARVGFTLIELLLVVAIVALLVALLLPALNAARETARLSHCTNNLKQVSLAALQHESAQGAFPSSGWGWGWQGDPNGGYGPKQPGGWAYNILEYLEHGDVRQAGSRLHGDRRIEARTLAFKQPISEFICPTRREARAYPVGPIGDNLAANFQGCGTNSGCLLARSDYQANSGSTAAGTEYGPVNQHADKVAAFNWGLEQTQNGVMYQRSAVRIAQIADGTTKTYLVGEKYLNPDHYTGGHNFQDNQGAYVGHDNDMNGYAGNGNTLFPPVRDKTGVVLNWNFGSAHPNVWNVSFCDGSVHSIDYSIEGAIHLAGSGRHDLQGGAQRAK